jgi:hypothetical protein
MIHNIKLLTKNYLLLIVDTGYANTGLPTKTSRSYQKVSKLCLITLILIKEAVKKKNFVTLPGE